MRIMSGHCVSFKEYYSLVSFEVTGNKNATVGSTKFNTIYIHVHVYEKTFSSVNFEFH